MPRREADPVDSLQHDLSGCWMWLPEHAPLDESAVHSGGGRDTPTDDDSATEYIDVRAMVYRLQHRVDDEV